jgi:hypothetical protein
LCSLASLIARNTKDRDIGEFMTHFTNIDYLDPDFKRLCNMFRNGVKMSFDLDKTLKNLEGINDLRLCMEIDVCGSVEIIEEIKATVTNTAPSDSSFCNECCAKNKCNIYKFANKYDYYVSSCKNFIISHDDIYKNLVDDLKNSYHQGHDYVVRNDKSSITFTKYGCIETFCPDRDTFINLYEILEKYRPYFYFRETLNRDGNISIWIYTTKKQYIDHVNHILNARTIVQQQISQSSLHV